MSEKIKTLYEDKGQTEVLYPRTVFEAVGNGIETLDEILEEIDSNKQDNLQSGKNIKTIEGQSLVGSGNIDITASNVGLENVINTGDSAIPTQNGTTKFTTGGAYNLDVTLKAYTDGKPTILYGTTAPTSSQGKDGDIYILYS